MEWYEVIFRLGLAALFGLIIGMEREHRHRPAGIKTHILVCMGAALVSIIQVYIVNDTIAQIQANPELADAIKSDYGRLGAQVISGIGFIGAGTILHTKGTIKGLTTAATLWLIACVGLAVGMGYYFLSAVTAALTAVVLILMHIIQGAVMRKKGEKVLDVVVINKREAMNFINNYCGVKGIVVKQMELLEFSEKHDTENDTFKINNYTYQYTILLPRTVSINTVVTDWQMDENIMMVYEISND